MITKYTSEIFDVLRKGQFICSNGPEDDIQKLYKVLEDDETFEDLYEYFYQINYILEQGNEYFYFSRIENNADIDRKLEKAYNWIDILDFFKTFDSSFDELAAFNPDGYFISNGPGDPEPLFEAQAVAKEIIKRNLPLFGICLGHQVIALANGISTYKMHNGHRGINHPVKNLLTGKGEITSQNHGFAINREEAEANENVEITHVHLNDHTVAGIRLKDKNAFSVQYHPEASPGPHDSEYLFDEFISNIKQAKKA